MTLREIQTGVQVGRVLDDQKSPINIIEIHQSGLGLLGSPLEGHRISIFPKGPDQVLIKGALRPICESCKTRTLTQQQINEDPGSQYVRWEPSEQTLLDSPVPI